VNKRSRDGPLRQDSVLYYKQSWCTRMSEHARVDGIYPFPAVMQTRTIETNGTSIHVRVGGHGPAVVMLHGFGTTGDMWGHLASALIADHTIIVPDLRGLGLSSKPASGYDRRIRRRTWWASSTPWVCVRPNW
jgi:Alpha/beta hydrolase family